MKGHKALRRARFVLAFGCLLAGGLLASGALGMTFLESNPPGDTGSTATETSTTATTDTGSTATDTTPTSTESATTDSTTTTDSTPPTTTGSASTLSPSISSDKEDYTPGSTVTLTGTGWGAGEPVHIFVNDDVGQTWSYNADVTANSDGGFANQFQLPMAFVATYTVRATGASGAVATTSFTDGSISSATIGIRLSDCATAQSSFTAGSTVCSHVVVQIQGNGNTNYRIQWYAPGVDPATGAPAQDSLFQEPNGSVSGTHDVTLAVSTIGMWTVLVCNRNTAGACSSSFQVTPTTFTVTAAARATSTALASNNTPSTFGQSVQFTATVTASGGDPSGVGTVAFFSDAVAVTGCGAVSLTGNQAACTTSALSASGSPHSITAQYSGVSSGSPQFTASTSPALSQVVNKANQTITFGALADKSFGDADFSVSATASSGLAVTFSVLSGSCTVSGSTVHITAAGSCTVRASQGGNGNYNAAAPVDQSFSIAKADQTITFGALADKSFGDADFSVSATASSGLAVTFGSSGDCSVSGDSVHITGAGSCTITASQAGNGNYNAAPNVDRTFTIAKADQAITFGAIADRTFGDPDFTVSAAGGGSGNPVTFSALGDCTVSGDSVHITGAGTCTVTAHQAGNGNYNAAPNVDRTFTIAKADQAITFPVIPGKVYLDPNFDPGATAPGGPVSYTSSGDCTIVSGNVHITGAGTCTVTAHQGGSSNYNAAPNVDRTFTIAKANQTITFATLANKTLGSADFTVSASASSGLTVAFSSMTPSVCTMPAAATVHILTVGLCTIRASQAGNGNYNPASNVDQSFNINFIFNGFFQPVDNIKLNVAQAGSAIPVKFDLSGDQGLNIFAANYPVSVKIACDTSLELDTIEETVTAGGSSLSYGGGQYIYVWKTEKSWASSCRRLDVKFIDGVTKSATFQFKK
jgi:hypothetical protein